MLRAVLDTNIVLSAAISGRSDSPTREVIERWQRKEFEILHSDEILLFIIGHVIDFLIRLRENT